MGAGARFRGPGIWGRGATAAVACFVTIVQAKLRASSTVVRHDAAGLSITDDGGRVQIRVRTNAQADVRQFREQRMEVVDTLLVRRLSLNVEAVVKDRLTLRLMSDFTSAKTNVVDAYASYRVSPALTVLVGKTKSPFDLERLVSQTDLAFVERAYPTTLAPNRDVGLQLSGDLGAKTVSYQLGWVRGTRDGDSTQLRLTQPREMVARLLVHPFKALGHSSLRGFGCGVAVSQGERESIAPNGYRTQGQQRFFSWRTGVTSEGTHTRAEPQTFFYAGPVGITGAWVMSRQSLATPGRTARSDVTNEGWYLATQCVLTGESASYRGVAPARPFTTRTGGWGALEIAARVSGLTIDEAAFPILANPATAAQRARGATVGLNWHINFHLKASLNLEHTALASAGSAVIFRDERALLGRLQVRF